MAQGSRLNWATPRPVFDFFNRVFGPFDLDAAASAENTKCENFLTDAFYSNWHGKVWCNPPYRKIEDWIYKAEYQIEKGHADCVVMLLPSRTDQKWFRYLVEESKFCDGLYFSWGRIRFEPPRGVEASAPREGSVAVVFRSYVPPGGPTIRSFKVPR